MSTSSASAFIASIRRNRPVMFGLVMVAWIVAALSGSVLAMLASSVLLVCHPFFHEDVENHSAARDSRIAT